MHWFRRRRPEPLPAVPVALTVAEQIDRLRQLGVSIRPELTASELEREIAWGHTDADFLNPDHPSPPDPARACLFWWLLTQDCIPGTRRYLFPARHEFATRLTADVYREQLRALTDAPVEILRWEETWHPEGSDEISLGGRRLQLPHRHTVDSRAAFLDALLAVAPLPSVFIPTDRWAWMAGVIVPVPGVGDHRQLRRLLDDTVHVAFDPRDLPLPEHLRTAGLSPDPDEVAHGPRQEAVVARRRAWLSTTGAPPLSAEEKIAVLALVGIHPYPGRDTRWVARDGLYASDDAGRPVFQHVHVLDENPDLVDTVAELAAVTGTRVSAVTVTDDTLRLTVAGTAHAVPLSDPDPLERVAGLLAPADREMVSTGDLIVYPLSGTWASTPEVGRV